MLLPFPPRPSLLLPAPPLLLLQLLLQLLLSPAPAPLLPLILAPLDFFSGLGIVHRDERPQLNATDGSTKSVQSFRDRLVRKTARLSGGQERSEAREEAQLRLTARKSVPRARARTRSSSQRLARSLSARRLTSIGTPAKWSGPMITGASERDH